MRDWFRRLMCLVLLLASCEEREGVAVYEVEPAASYAWPEPEATEGAAEGFVWNVPAGFWPAPEVPEALHGDYRLPGTTQMLPGRLTLSAIPGEGGGLDANVRRWTDQYVPIAPRDLSELVTVSPALPHPWGTVWIVHITGQYAGPTVPDTMLAAIVRIVDPADPTGPALVTWFLKLTGDRATVSDAADAMTEVIYSLRPEGTPRPELNIPLDPNADPHAGVPDAPPLHDPSEDEAAEAEAPDEPDEPGEVSP
ncbi:MAG: hypothetical protein AAGA29_04720 [Planctomycetota bacterium]